MKLRFLLIPLTLMLGGSCLAQVSPKLRTGHANPILDHVFTADPTAVEYGGRLYSVDSPTIATVTSLGTDWKECKAKCKILGVHDLIFVVKGRVKFDYWKFGLRSR